MTRPLASIAGLFTLAAFADGPVDLLKDPVIFRGSSFKATHKAVKTLTDNYYTAVNDGKADTWWEPMEPRGPHFIEMLWNQPVRISGVTWRTSGIATAKLCQWKDETWVPVAEISGDDGKADFPESASDRFRLSIIRTVGTPKVFELSLTGPEQYLLPPEIPSGNENGTVSFSDVRLPARPLRPGETIDIRFRASATPDTNPYGFLLELSDRAALKDIYLYGADFTSERIAAKPDGDGQVSVRMRIPSWTPDGTNDILVTAIADATGRRIRTGGKVLGSVNVVRTDLPQPPEPARKVAVGENAAGQRGFLINGTWHPAFCNRFYGNQSPERLAATAGTGLEILYWQNRGLFPAEGAALQDLLDWFDRRIRTALRVNPRNYFILSQRALPSAEWIKAHPEELMRLEDGTANPCNLVSFGSDLYLRQTEDYLERLIDFISRQPYADRVIGYHLWGCTKYDAFIGGAVPNRKTKDRKDFILGDYHPGAIRRFREFLHRKYRGDSAALRTAWHDAAVTFDNALVSRADLVREDIPGSVFRDPVRSRPAIDYLEFFPTLIGDYLRGTAALIKRRTGGKALVLVHYGAVKNFLTFSWGEQLQSNNCDLEALLDDPNIDAFVQAQPYETREAGNAMHVYQPARSIDLRNKLYLFDHDHRTIGAGTLTYGRHRSQYETAAVFARDFGHQWIENSGAWISDMSLAPWRKFDEYRLPWFTMPEVVGPIHDTLAALGTLKTPRRSAAEIAVVLSLNSPRYEDMCRANPHYKGLVNDLLLQNGFPFLGAPYDTILSGDLYRPNLPDYRLYVFLNPSYFTDAERTAINGLKRDGKVLAWFYAPGYVTDSGLDLKAAKAVSGIALAIDPKASGIPTLAYEADSPLARGLAGKTLATSTWGGLDYLSPAAISPVFYADDPEVRPAGRYPDGKVAYGFRDFGNWKSVWCGVPNFDLPALVNLVRFAGVHLYAEAPVVLNADNRLMMVHNGYEGERTVKVSLPRPAHVSDLRTGRPVADGRTFDVRLAAPETKLLRLDYR